VLIACYSLIAVLLTLYRRKTKVLSKLQHMDNILSAMFCNNMAAIIAKVPL